MEYGIKGFPTIKVFVPGKLPVDYQGAGEVKPIVEFALQQFFILEDDEYDLEKLVDDICGVAEWDPILEELQEMVNGVRDTWKRNTSMEKVIVIFYYFQYN
ncbi:PDI-like 2-3 [Actinidia rufa]|uniref:PDI-like 2-3 n=1 Tax=Actinidia rufa TaxID=165716 RepID=A0A7J0DIL8_9ERIC|nr:PDI-like 2-3 [Actinidia rufa]